MSKLHSATVLHSEVSHYGQLWVSALTIGSFKVRLCFLEWYSISQRSLFSNNSNFNILDLISCYGTIHVCSRLGRQIAINLNTQADTCVPLV